MAQHILSFATPDPADGIVGQSPLLSEVLQRVQRVAPTDMPVLIYRLSSPREPAKRQPPIWLDRHRVRVLRARRRTDRGDRE